MKMVKKIYIVIVIYNKKIIDSITFNNLEKIKLENVEIIIIDNSTTKYNIIDDNRYHYLSMNGNVGLSKAYNKALDYMFDILHASNEDYVIWMDDDTNINYDYFYKLNDELSRKSVFDIYNPIIVGQDGKYYSPNDSRYLKNKLIKDKKDIINIKKYNAINSCLCVNLSIYNTYRYDEKLFLDEVDKNFFDDMRFFKKKFKTIDIIIHQNFSQRGKILNKKTMINRYKIRIKDIMTYGRKKMWTNLLSLMKSVILTIQMGLKCKSITLVLECLKIAFSCFFKSFISSLSNK